MQDCCVVRALANEFVSHVVAKSLMRLMKV